MANRRSTHIDSVFEEHKNIISQFESTLSDSVNRLNNSIESSVRRVASSLGSAEEMADKLKQSESLGLLVDEYKDLLNEHSDLTKSMSYVNDELMERFQLSAKELGEVIDLIDEYNKLTERIDENESRLQDPNITAEERDRLDAAKREDEFKKRKIDNEILSDNRYHLLWTRYVNNNNEKAEIDDILNSKSRILEITTEIGEKEREIGSEVDRTNDRLDNRVKKLDGIAKTVRTTFGIVKELGQKWIEVDDIVTKYGRSIGVSSEQTKAYRKNVLENFGKMAGRLGITVQEMMKFQEQYAKNTNRSTILTNKQVESLASLSKITSEIATETMVKHMDEFGASVDTASGYLAQAYARASQVGLNAAKTSEEFAKNIKMASKYSFREGINGISKMTLLSQKLKFNMESMSSALDKFNTIEGAISTSANIQLLGGAYAAQFSNPMQVMGESLLDAEGFTQRIIDTFSNFAYFDKTKGMAEMSPFEKQRMRLAAQELGINYDEAWNIASQTAKGKAVEQELVNTPNLSKENREYIKNLAQYDTEAKEFYINYYDKDGNEQRKAVSSITSNEGVDEIRRTQVKDDILRNDVHEIKHLLAEYVNETVGETKTSSEILTGIQERARMGAANMVDYPMRSLKFGANEVATGSTQLIQFLVGSGVFLKLFGDSIGNFVTRGRFNGRATSNIPNNTQKQRPRRNSGRSNTLATASKKNFYRGLRGVGLGRKASRALTKIGPKTLSSLGYAGAAVSSVYSIYDAVSANKSYKQTVAQINQDTRLSQQEKAVSKYNAKRERNRSIGNAIGTTAGAVIGGIVGGPIGAMVGSAVGSWIGKGVGKAVTKKPKDNNLLANNTQVSSSANSMVTQNMDNITIGNDVHGIYEILANGDIFEKSSLDCEKLIEKCNTIISTSMASKNISYRNEYLAENNSTNNKSSNNSLVNNSSSYNRNEYISQNTSETSNISSGKINSNVINNSDNLAQNNDNSVVNSSINKNITNNTEYLAQNYSNGVSNSRISNNPAYNTEYLTNNDGNIKVSNNRVNQNVIHDGDYLVNNNSNTSVSSSKVSNNPSYATEYFAKNDENTRISDNRVNNSQLYNSEYSSNLYENGVVSTNLSNKNIIRDGDYFINNKSNVSSSKVSNNPIYTAEYLSDNSDIENISNSSFSNMSFYRNGRLSNQFYSMPKMMGDNNSIYYNSDYLAKNYHNSISNGSYGIGDVSYNSDYLASNYDYSISSGEVINRPMVISKPTVGTKTYIRQESQQSNNIQANNGKMSINPMSLNVNGSIKLVSDKGISSTIDANKLMSDPRFINQMVGLIADCLNKNTSIGRMVSSNNHSRA